MLAMSISAGRSQLSEDAMFKIIVVIKPGPAMRGMASGNTAIIFACCGSIEDSGVCLLPGLFHIISNAIKKNKIPPDM